uniref:very-long-chain (3R)-3-hydroxyacyl-CoA dehydratase n=1 Tax=Entomoneis paludosa TaxID=265537 RepID=A0A7S3DQR9_9STRA|eukprot:CAMPEP_0172457406 /NCGR_PEP_ID=MMETSP1065-20121228/22095_1 /TAXON_ID=265537 /ORGANISM="Amphiprora paludosa, Strain CCMP125" /LENGTH=235 /DNA_ID=CAMNT_0013211143 /DNA_START=56 /DNA_END=763 /DNA_ORIENTATION=+
MTATTSDTAAPSGMQRTYLLFSNATLMMVWARVLRLIYRSRYWPVVLEAWRDGAPTPLLTGTWCPALVTPALNLALALSFMEVFNAAAGLTRSKPQLAALFCMVRAVMQLGVAPLLSDCQVPAHIFTITCWSLGDMIRFGCFLLDLLVPGGTVAKRIRYTVGPLLFPLGALGEVLMVATYANEHNDWPWLVLACIAWPMGFYPLMTQLWKQRTKYYQQFKAKSKQQQSESKAKTN